MAVIVVTYVGVAVALQAYAGIGTEGLGLGNPETSDNVFAALAGPVMGQGLASLLFLAVLASSASSLQTTFLPPARTLLAMATYGALPAPLRPRPPGHPGAVVRDGDLRRGRRCLLRGDGPGQRERPRRHDLRARPDDLLLLRASRRPPASGTSAASCAAAGATCSSRAWCPASARSCSPRCSCRRRSTPWTPPTAAAPRCFGVGSVFVIGDRPAGRRPRSSRWCAGGPRPAFFRGETLRTDTPVAGPAGLRAGTAEGRGEAAPPSCPVAVLRTSRR